MTQQYIPITGIDCLIPCLFIDKNAPSTFCMPTAPHVYWQ